MIGQIAVMKMTKIADGFASRKAASEIGNQASGGTVRSTWKMGSRPRIAHTAFLDGRHESEGRSHAFNSLVDADGGGLIGIPTVDVRVGRRPWRSDASDVSFLSLDRTGMLSSIGELRMRADSIHPSYRCEVSCVDWYGNARPIFADGRIFALLGYELVEGRMVGGRIREVDRVNFAPSFASWRR